MPDQQIFSRGYRTNGKSLSCFVCLFAAIELDFHSGTGAFGLQILAFGAAPN
jgi:hypothetical protein